MNYFSFKDKCLPLGNRTYIMGILNVTPDSFSDGNKWNEPEKALYHALEMERQGADIIDVGAFSTRPGCDTVSPEEELRRLSAVLPGILKNVTVPVSVDTFVPEIAEKCLSLGVSIINDVSGVFNEKMAEIIKKYRAGWVLMHGGVATAKTESVKVYENGIVNDVQHFFDDMYDKCVSFGINPSCICLDPGFGFSKTDDRNIELLKNLDKLDTHGAALLSALSRKRFVGTLSNEPKAENRDPASVVCDILSIFKGADIIRVHDVEGHVEAVRTADRVIRSNKS